MKINERMRSPKPKFFYRLSKIGLGIASIGGAVLGAPVAFPAFLIKIAGYLVVSGGIISAVSEATVKGEQE